LLKNATENISFPSRFKPLNVETRKAKSRSQSPEYNGHRGDIQPKRY